MNDALFSGLALGFSVASTPDNLLWCLAGAFLGTLIGVLPGLGPVATIALLLPVTYGMTPTGALIMLAGVYYGAQYGGSTTAILLNIPGETSSVVTALDGHKMARQGRAGIAITTAALASFFAGTVSTLVIAVSAPLLASFALKFGSAEYFALTILGIVGAVVLARGSLLKAIAMVVVGMALGLVGLDVNSGQPRFTFGITDLYDGIDIVPIAMGLFAISDIVDSLEKGRAGRGQAAPVDRLFASWRELGAAIRPTIRGTAVGSVLGLLPGSGAVLAAFAAYAVEKRIARDPSRFGQGAIEGVAAPEAANNAGAQTSFIPMLTLGIPPNATMALMVAAMLIHGITPGPQIIAKQPDLFWGLIASMWIGNLMLLLINLPLVAIWVSMLKIPYRYLYPLILVICAIGVYSVNNAPFNLLVLVVAGFAGWVLLKVGFEPAPLALGFILGPVMEENLRRALMISGGDVSVLVRSPTCVVLLALAAILLATTLAPHVRRKRDEAFQE
jgi:putative tricarboxylic transport membrane protein